MIYNKIFKRVAEKFYVSASIVDIKHTTTEEVQLSGSSVVVKDKSNTDVSTTLVDVSTLAIIDHPDRTDGTKCVLTIRCRNGTAAASPYKVQFLMATTLGNLIECDTDLIVI